MAEQPTTGQPYTAEDIALVTDALRNAIAPGTVLTAKAIAAAVIPALAAAGRLLPEGASPNDLGDGYRQLELAQGRWTWIDELGVRVMVELQRPLILLRWRPVSINEENTEPPPSAATIASVMDGDDG